MDQNTTISELKQQIKDFCSVRDWDQFHNPKDLSIGIITEASELLELFRFKTNDEVSELFKNPESLEKIKDEMADVFIFLVRLSQITSIDLSSSFLDKLAKNDKKYPIDKVKGQNKKYTEY
jgi:NTP pyrophosphatase (non-canonical NTP hydrolase)